MGVIFLKKKKSACGNVGGHPGLAEILYGGLAVPLDPLQQVMQTRSTRYDPGGPLGGTPVQAIDKASTMEVYDTSILPQTE